MRPFPILTAGALALALVAPAIAAPGDGHAGHERGQPMDRATMVAKAEQRFAKFDTNADGAIDATEVAARHAAMKTARAEKLAAMSAEDKAKRETKIAERRAERKARRAEMAASGTAPAPQERAKRGGWLARLDADADGRITREEFAVPMLQRFERLDTNGDGTVTREERVAARKAARG